MNNENSKKILHITLFVILMSMIIIQWGSINTLEKRINSLEEFTNIKSFENQDFKASRLPLWRQCVNGEDEGKPLAYAFILVDNNFMIKVPEDKLAYKNGTLYFDKYGRCVDNFSPAE